MRDKIQNDKATTLIFAFVLPILLILPAFAAVGIYPFGEKSLLIIDMHSEYIDYLAQMHETIHSSGSFLRSWNMGLGLNMLGLIAFYTSSPFNIIVLLLPLSVITEAVFVITLLKLGAAGLFFSIFAREVFPEAKISLHIVFSVAYALMGYNIAYSSNIMWLDGTAFLPLVLLGTERILRDGRYKLFIFSLIYIFFTSYYIGYMIGVFSFLYFTARYFSNYGQMSLNSLRMYSRMLLRFVGSAVLAAGCCAVLLLPAFFNLKDGQSAMWNERFEFKLNHPVITLASKLLPGAYDSLTDSGLPNIYCTTLAIMLCVLYFCTKAVPRREKFIFGGLLSFIIFSFSCEFFDVAWHAFEVPTWFPARYSFVFSFLVLFLGLRCACVLENVSRRAILASAIILMLLFSEIAVSRFDFITSKNIIAGILTVIFCSAILMLWKNGNRRMLSALLVVLVCIEASGAAVFTALGMDEQFGYKNRGEYKSFMQSYGNAVAHMKATDAGVYRCEILGARNANGAMALGYNGISHYSTTTNQKLNQFLRDLGYNKGTINELRFSKSTPLTNGLLGVKYVLSEDDMSDAYILREKVGGVGIYENPAAFPLAFWAPSESLGFKSDSENPFSIQNELVSALTGENREVFTPLIPSDIRLYNAERIMNGNHIEYSKQNQNKESAVELDVQSRPGDEAFAFFPVYNNKFAASRVFVNGISAGRDFAYRENSIISLKSTGESTVAVIPEKEIIMIKAEYFASLDLEAAKKAAETAAQNQMQFTKFLDTVVEGKITAPQDGLIATTFPFDEGWTAQIDGKRIDSTSLAGVFLAVPVSEGEHTITMRYLPNGFAAGLVITIISVCGMLLFFLLRKRRVILFLLNRKEKVSKRKVI